MLDTAFEALKTFDWGTDLAVVAPIEDASIAAHDKPEARQDLENRLIAALKSELTRDAQDYVCRKLATIGTMAAVPALAKLLIKSENSHMARFALERIPGPEADQALRDALPLVNGNQKIGVISSIGARRDSSAIASLAQTLNDSDSAIARSAAMALGTIGSTESAVALKSALVSSSTNRLGVVDALLSCAESLLNSDQRADANSIYKTLAHESQPRIVRLAATRGLLACASKQA
jgi:HEAT repeat protein